MTSGNEQEPIPVPLPAVRIEAVLAEKLNLADFQNAVPLIRELWISNDLDRRVTELELCVSAEPPFLKPKQWRLDALRAGDHQRITDLDLTLDGAVFHRLTEAEPARVTFTLTSGSPSESLAQLDVGVELLPRNQWGGIGQLPEMLAAFVQPNDPAVERVLKQASGILAKSLKNPSLNGYIGGPKGAWEIASAIWSALASHTLSYALPPSSFEIGGQKVRGPSQVLDSGLATCLDLALFYCAACEQAGLHPILVLTKGHALAGVWLRPEEFSNVVVDDITALRKRIRLQELVLFETTLLTNQPAAPAFSLATEAGADQLAEAKGDVFELAVDIHRARMHRIKPLASAESVAYEKGPAPTPVPVEPVLEEAPDLPEEVEAPEVPSADLDPKDRLARWQRKLLDLSLRNNLLNFKEGKKSIRLEAPDPGALEDRLAAGSTFKLLPLPDLMEGVDPRSQAIHESRTHEDVRRGLAIDALSRSEIFVGLTQDEMEGRLVEQFRTARTNLQEGGANTLFLALGFLNWTRADKPDQRLRAPLILIPVTLNRRSVRSGFTLSLHEDEPRFNPTLLEMLRQDFGLNLGIVEGELPTDTSGLDIAGIWRMVSRAIKDIKGWEVREDVILAMFSFAKHLMWKDLTERVDQLRENPVVRHLIDTPRETYSSDIGFPEPRSLDRDFHPERMYCPLQADSSQLSAVLAGARGKDFVLIGPPGTGKSQTIANLIAQCLAEGKKVLFVSEKIAALDVVHRRLREVGLGEFCLEIHSNKARKIDILQKLQTAWEARGTVDQEVWKAEANRLRVLREQLNTYVERLHLRHPNGLTLYQAIAQVVGGSSHPTLGLAWSSPDAHQLDQLNGLRDLADRLAVNVQALGQNHLHQHPLAILSCSDWSPAWQQRLIATAQALDRSGQALETAFQTLRTAMGLPPLSLVGSIRIGLNSLIRALPGAYGRDWSFALLPNADLLADRLSQGLDLLQQHQALNQQLSQGWPDEVVRDCEQGLAFIEERRMLRENLGSAYPPAVLEEIRKGLGFLDSVAQATRTLSMAYAEEVENLDVFQLQRDWNQAESSFWPRSWLRKRKVAKVLQSVTQGEGVLDAARDVHTLAKIRLFQKKVEGLELGPLTDGIWRGRETHAQDLRSLLAFQAALAALGQEKNWEDKGFERIADGFCGERLQKQLRAMRRLAEVENAIANLPLEAATEGLWKGPATDTGLLNEALQFLAMMQRIRESGPITGEFPQVSRKDGGETLANDHRILHARRQIEHQIAEYQGLGETTLGLWKGLRTDRGEATRAIAFVASLREALGQFASGLEDLVPLREALHRLLTQGNPSLSPSGEAMAAGRAFQAFLAQVPPVLDAFSETGQVSPSGKVALEQEEPLAWSARCQSIVQQEHRLRAWCAWQKVKQQAQGMGMAPLVEAIEQGRVASNQVRDVFETDYCRWWVNAVVDQEKVIRDFVSAEHEKRIQDFRALDERFTHLTRDWVRARLCAGIPPTDQIPKNSGWGELRHEMTKKKRHLPVRTLMEKAPGAVNQLAPCLLMSPLSIAQYLAADSSAFDLVVFDEASQIPIWDAIGAIARGKQVVMVGDPKQLPPTNFFNRADLEGDDEDVELDLESILDECLGANLPTLDLNWHYRSRHESLIAFSNHHYYRGRLVTFPSPVTQDHAVSFHLVKGIYEKGGARINRSEAQAVVADVVKQLKTGSRLTIGIVTFNVEQQSLIENLLDEERRKHPWIEPYFADSELEPVFVKNLESVQGDERDIIYFSITYGPDNSGAVSMNFGPMNRTGGERRLNVAITRARHELRVFSSLRAEQINLSRTQAFGVRDLKYFLDFAERGTRALSEEARIDRGGFDSPFEVAVAQALERKGWTMHTQVGVSAYRIDLGVVHPDVPGTFLAGIECDGATYHRSATARDRDKLREHVLRGLGWEILRVWSTDWWVDPETTLEVLHQRLKDLLEDSQAKRKAHAQTATEEASDVTAMEATLPPIEGAPEVDTFANPDEAIQSDSAPSPASSLPDAPAQDSLADPDRFFDLSYDHNLTRMISDIVHEEGPIHEERLARLIARKHGWLRTGTRIQTRVGGLASQCHQTSNEDVGRFFWPHDLPVDDYVPPRHAPAALNRTVNEISMPELASLCRIYLDAGQAEANVLILVARSLGLSRLAGASRARLEQAIRQAASAEH
jgi:very-short-patch-repair endonuclease